MTFQRKDVEWYAAGEPGLQKGKARTGWDGEELPGIETENEKLKRTIPFWRALLRVSLAG